LFFLLAIRLVFFFRARDHVVAVEPVAEVNQLASLAAKGEVGPGLDRFV